MVIMKNKNDHNNNCNKNDNNSNDYNGYDHDSYRYTVSIIGSVTSLQTTVHPLVGFSVCLIIS